MSESLGKKIAIISAVTLLVAACSKKDDGVDAGSGDLGNGNGGVVEETVAPVKTEAELEAERLADIARAEAARFGAANMGGFEGYVGNDRIFFEYDSSELSSSARDDLNKAAEWMNNFDRVRFTIEGHCDERGTREYNLALGERRATAVKNYLVALGIPASRLDTISYGKERPASVGNYSANRRGVFIIR